MMLMDTRMMCRVPADPTSKGLVMMDGDDLVFVFLLSSVGSHADILIPTHPIIICQTTF
jgi:hypothetical protein